METWLRLPLDVGPASAQARASEELLAALPPGPPRLRWYWAERPALILGATQEPGEVRLDLCKERGLEVFKRASGGTAVLGGPALLSLDVALPAGHPLVLPDVTRTYHWLAEAWRHALAALGVEARVVPAAEARARPDPRKAPPGSDDALVARACFGSLSPYEVAAGPRKLVGLAQVRRRPGALLQAGLPLVWEAPALAELLAADDAERARLEPLLRARAVGLDGLLAAPPPREAVMAAFEGALAELHGAALTDAG